ncbi:MAG: DUF4169 family protein [Phenylobacterium sp.]|uniref:DUF4169 family protein n=1 Tax=Phenylobacterium sp. TaxID=1871053 RepID=UPI0027369D88|nr:DUF4169 family protein [Phenylobacterium sp.]MDP3173752.1 DUF4169 family protein [Phenylobacterium sp.]
MAEPVNLNQARKARAKQDAKAAAAQNRVRFGRSKAERAEAQAHARKADSQLDGAKREP